MTKEERALRAQDNHDLTQGPITKKILLFALPTIAGNLFQQLYNVVDSLIVGNFAREGTACLAAVNASFPVMMFFSSLFMGVSMGVNIIVSQYKGAKDYANLASAKTYNDDIDRYRDEQQEKYKWIEYHKWKFKAKTYTALTGGQKCFVLMTRFEMGILGSYNKDKRSPFETFYMGGDGMSGYSTSYAEETVGLRGYENGSLTPYGSSGYAYDRFTLELRYPFMLGNTTIYGLGFLEGGNAWNQTRNFNPFDIKRSAGLGVRIFLPMVGLMGIDWAYGFDRAFPTANKGGSQFHFILGQEF